MIAWLLWLLLQAPADLEAAERAFRAGDCEAAMRHWHAALAAPDAPEGAILFNLGNAAFRLGRFAEASWHWRRAALRLPHDPDLDHNLSLAASRLGHDDQHVDPWPRLGDRPLLHAGLLLQGLGLCGAILLTGRRRRAALAVAALGLGCHLRLGWLLWSPGARDAVVLAPQTELRQQPDHAAAALLPLHAGDLVTVRGFDGVFARVEHARGAGFLPRGDLGIVD